MARPRTSAVVLEMSGAFKRNPKRRRRRIPSCGPLNRKPDPHWPDDVKRQWRDLVSSLPRRLDIQRCDRGALHMLAVHGALLEQQKPASRAWLRLQARAYRLRDHFGLSPSSRRRLAP